MLVLIDAFVCVWACDPHIAGRRCLSPSIARLLIICVDTCSHCHCVCRNSLDDIHSILLFPEIHKQIKPAFCFWLRSFLFSSVQKPTEHFTFRKYSEKWLLNTNLSTMCFRSLCFFFISFSAWFIYVQTDAMGVNLHAFDSRFSYGLLHTHETSAESFHFASTQWKQQKKKHPSTFVVSLSKTIEDTK